MPQSLVLLDFERDRVAVELTLPINELELSFRQPLMQEPDQIIPRHGEELKSYAASHIHPVSPEGREWRVKARDISLKPAVPGDPAAVPDVIVHLDMVPPDGAPLRKFTLNYSVICHEVMSHVALISVRSDWNSATFSGKPEVLGTVQFTVTSVNIDRSSGSFWRGFHSVFALGMAHIAEGTDHLLFLLVLLLPAPLLVRTNQWSGHASLKATVMKLLKIVSAFTIGHSLTLALAAIGVVHLPSRLVETLIAISILVSAIHAMRPLFPGKEVFIAVGFGLVHGLAFASTIAGFGFTAWYMVMTILAFNIGIELMQLIIVALALPPLVMLSRTALYATVRWVAAVFAGIAALGWIGARAFDWPNPIEAPVEGIARHAWWVFAALTALALTGIIRQSRAGGANE